MATQKGFLHHVRCRYVLCTNILLIQGYHMYKEIWEVSCGQVYPCLREVGYAFNPFAVSVMKDSDIIGHVSRKSLATCSLFLHNHGTVKCTITIFCGYSASSYVFINGKYPQNPQKFESFEIKYPYNNHMGFISCH